MTVAFSAGDVAYWGLAIFLVLLGAGSFFALFKLGQLFDRVSSLRAREQSATRFRSSSRPAAPSTGSTTSSTSSTP